jgi:REP element-mobilizing transposase RayT
MAAPRKYEYRRNLPHLLNSERPLFLSFNTKDRWHLPPAARDIVLAACLEQHRKKFFFEAAVVMPDHVHFVGWILRDHEGYPFEIPALMKAIKGKSGLAVNRLLERSGKVWQEESFDHVLRSDEKLEETIEYIKENPVKRGLSSNSGRYRWLWISPEPFV